MPAKRSNKRKKPTGKKQPQLQFVGDNSVHEHGPNTSYSRHSDEDDQSDTDIIENSQPQLKYGFGHYKNPEDSDKTLKDAGLYEIGMTDDEKRDFLKVIAESRQMVEESQESSNSQAGSDDLFPMNSSKSDEIEDVNVETFVEDENNNSNSDEGLTILSAIPPKKRIIKARSILTSYEENPIYNAKFKSNSPETKTNQAEVYNHSESGSDDKTVLSTAESKETPPSSSRSIRIRENLYARKRNDRSVKPISVDHIPLYAPTNVPPRTYTQVIREYFDRYFETYAQTQVVKPREISWDRPVTTGRHQRTTIDLWRPGQRQRNLDDWFNTACSGHLSDSEISPKKPRMDNDSPMTVDSQNEFDNDSTKSKDEDCDNDNLKSYLTENVDFQFQGNIVKHSSKKFLPISEEEPVYVEVPPDDESESDPLENQESKNNRKSKDEGENLELNSSGQSSLMKKFWGIGKTENNPSSSLLTGKKNGQKKGKR